MTQCPLCGRKRARRTCPGVGQTICATCCGTKRQREIACPADCAYLSSAREHPAAVLQRRRERDLRYYLPLIADLSEPQYRLLLLFQAVMVRHATGELLSLRDEDIAEAAGSLASTLETARAGIIYEHRAASAPAQRLVADLSRVVREVVAGGGEAARTERDAATVLRRVQNGAAGAAAALPGDEPPVFLRLVTRVMETVAAGMAASEPAEAPEAPRIIVP